MVVNIWSKFNLKSQESSTGMTDEGTMHGQTRQKLHSFAGDNQWNIRKTFEGFVDNTQATPMYMRGFKTHVSSLM